jgi:hypothetical protein
VARRKRDEVGRLVAASRAAQGLPPTITDPGILDRVATLLDKEAETDAPAA